MAIIFEEALKKDLSKGNILPVYILFGEDSYLKTTYLNKIRDKITSEDDVFNFAKFVNGCNLQEVYDAVMQVPVMNDRKCVILSDYDYLHCDPSELDRLAELISQVPTETTFILYFDSIETDAKKGAKFKKLISACEKNGGAVVELKHRTKAELVKMLCEGANKRHCKMDYSVGNYLVELSGEDINLLKNELTKLCAFVGEGVITKSHIDEVCTVTVEANLYRLSDYVLSGNSTEALKMLDRLFFMRLEPIAIFYTVAGIFVDMYRVYSAKGVGVNLAEVTKTFGYGNKAFLVEKADKNVRKMDFNRLNLCLQTLVKTDNALKSYRANQKQLLEELIVKLIYIIVQGETLD